MNREKALPLLQNHPKNLTGNYVFSVRSQLPKKVHWLKIPKQKLLDAVEERASLQDGTYVDIQGCLKQISSKTCIEKNPVWHRSCYSDATNAIAIQRARDRLQHSISTGIYVAKQRGHKRTRSEMDETVTPSSSAPFTRSVTEPLRKDTAFFVKRMMARICLQYELKMLGRHFGKLLKSRRIKC